MLRTWALVDAEAGLFPTEFLHKLEKYGIRRVGNGQREKPNEFWIKDAMLRAFLVCYTDQHGTVVKFQDGGGDEVTKLRMLDCISSVCVCEIAEVGEESYPCACS